MRYDILLFDLDDTLLDFAATEAVALAAVLEEHGIPLTDQLRETYKTVNDALWAEHDRGEITLDTLFATRFTRTFELLGIEADGVALEAQYRRYLGERACPMEGAAEVCRALHDRARLYVVTNGRRETQLAKLAGIGLTALFLEVFDSESVGHRKPEPAYFAHLAAAIADFDPARTLLIGDSLATDIAGGRAAGLDTCWLTPAPPEGDTPATYTIRTLHELLPLLEREPQ